VKPSGPPRFEARGLYATGWSAGLPKKLDSLIQIIHRSGLNSLVVDVKDSDGAVTYYTPDVPLAVEIGACFKEPRKNRCGDIKAALKKLKDNHIHTIARIVCFNDPILARHHKEWAILSKAGGIWLGRGKPWVDPTIPQVQQYPIDLAKDAIKQGFDEIQWDYVRFPSDGNVKLCKYHHDVGKGQAAIVIAKFLQKAYAMLKPYGVPVSADIFGLTGTAKSDMGIGQKINPIADNVDYISPMVYPSHFALGEYHMPNPNAQPYRTVFLSLRDAHRRISGARAYIRPWIQAFTLHSPRYGPHEFLEEVKAVRDLNLTGFLCWNASNKYDIVESALTSPEGKKVLADLIAGGPKTPPAIAAEESSSGKAAEKTSAKSKRKHHG